MAEAARLLVNAQNPVIVADRAARTPAGIARLVELAEAIQAPVVDQHGRMNFPSHHPLNHTDSANQLIANADVILGLELTDFWGTVNTFRDAQQRTSRSRVRPGTRLISITAVDLFTKSNFQDFQRYPEVDVAMAADAEATLPALTEAVPQAGDGGPARGVRGAPRASRAGARTSARGGAGRGHARVGRVADQHGADVRRAVGADPQRGLVAGVRERQHQRLDCTGCGTSTSTTSTWAARGRRRRLRRARGRGRRAGQSPKHGRLSVNIQRDGDMLYAPGVLWTAAHHKIPLLTVMHNNRAYHQEVMHIQRMANRHQRGITRWGIGTTIDTPNVDFAKVAQGMGVYGEGPIENPKDLGTGAATGARRREEGRARVGGRRHAAALRAGGSRRCATRLSVD